MLDQSSTLTVELKRTKSKKKMIALEDLVIRVPRFGPLPAEGNLHQEQKVEPHL